MLFFLAADFDKENWREDASAFLATCSRFSIPTALERSRSGNGAHVWFFFEETVPATLARKLGSYLLTETMENRPELGFGSYDRFFPNQDTLPKGGFGNLIALPLQKQAGLPALASSWTARSILPVPRHTGETDGRMRCSSRTVIWFCDSWPRMSASNLMTFLMPSQPR